MNKIKEERKIAMSAALGAAYSKVVTKDVTLCDLLKKLN